MEFPDKKYSVERTYSKEKIKYISVVKHENQPTKQKKKDIKI